LYTKGLFFGLYRSLLCLKMVMVAQMKGKAAKREKSTTVT
jgi:hypothetical protein